MYLFFDTEAIGLPKKWNRPHSDTFNWPRMVQIAWMVFDEQKEQVESHDYLIIPEGFEIPYESERIHGIDTIRAKEEGIPLKEALQKFAQAVEKATYIVAHNLNFDQSVVGAEYIRKSVDHRLFQSENYCIMQEGTYFCKLPGKGGGYKWPTLSELHFKLFGEKFDQPNSALFDAEITAKCFFKLLEIEAIDLF